MKELHVARRGLVKDRVAALNRQHTRRAALLRRQASERLRQINRQIAAIDAALKAEKATVKSGGVPEGWSKAKRAQMDTDGRWTLKRRRKRPAGPSGPPERSQSELVIPVFGYKNHVGIDRRHGFIRTFAVTDAAVHDGRQLGQLLDRENTASSAWADTAYRSAADVALLVRRGLVPQFTSSRPRSAGSVS